MFTYLLASFLILYYLMRLININFVLNRIITCMAIPSFLGNLSEIGQWPVRFKYFGTLEFHFKNFDVNMYFDGNDQ